MKTIPIKFNDEDLKNLAELEDLLELTNTYGADPKAIKLSIKLSIDKIKHDQAQITKKVIPSLKPREKALFLASITKPIKEQISQDIKQK